MPAHITVPLRALAALALLALGGCATLTDTTRQQVLVQTVQDNHELFGAGCILSNDAGKWFVTTPDRVVIVKSHSPLRVDCKKDGVASANEDVGSKPYGKLWRNVFFTAGIGYFIDRQTGAGYDYPSTLTIVMKKTGAAPSSVEDAPAGSGSSTVY